MASAAIPAQSLDAALDALSRQTGLQFVYAAQVAGQARSRAVPAGLPADEALLLQLVHQAGDRVDGQEHVLGQLLHARGADVSQPFDHAQFLHAQVGMRSVGGVGVHLAEPVEKLLDESAQLGGVAVERGHDEGTRFEDQIVRL